MNGHGLHGTVDDAEAAALLCELRASPVVHTSALYPRPSFAHVTHDLRLPSPHEILAQAEWDRTQRRFSSSSERLTSEPQHPLPRPAFSPAPTTHAYLFPEATTPTTSLPPPRYPPLPPLTPSYAPTPRPSSSTTDSGKRKRETEPDPPIRRARLSDDSDGEYFSSANASATHRSLSPVRAQSPPRRGYLSMSALGVLEAPPRSLPTIAHDRNSPSPAPDPRLQYTHSWRDPSSSHPETPTREYSHMAPLGSGDYQSKGYYSSREYTAALPAREFASPIPPDGREYGMVAKAESSVRGRPTGSHVREPSWPREDARRPILPPISSSDERRMPSAEPRHAPDDLRRVAQLSPEDHHTRRHLHSSPSSSDRSSRHQHEDRRSHLSLRIGAPDNVYMFPQPAMSPYGSGPGVLGLGGMGDGRGDGRSRETERIDTSSERLGGMSSERMRASTPTSALFPTYDSVLASSSRPRSGTNTSVARGVEESRARSGTVPSSFTSSHRPGSQFAQHSQPSPTLPSIQSVTRFPPSQPSPVQPSNSYQTPTTQPTPGFFRAPSFSGAAAAKVTARVDPYGFSAHTRRAPIVIEDSPEPETPPAAVPEKRVEKKRTEVYLEPVKFDGPKFGPRVDTDIRGLGLEISPSSARHETFGSAPILPRYNTSPVTRLDSRPRPAPEPYTDTETEKDAPSSPLSDETADEADEQVQERVRLKDTRRGRGSVRGKRRTTLREEKVDAVQMDVDADSSIGKTGAHPYPFRTSTSPSTARQFPTRPESYSTRTDAHALHGDTQIYPANSPPAPKTVFGPAPAPSSARVTSPIAARSPVARTTKMVSPVIHAKQLSPVQPKAKLPNIDMATEPRATSPPTLEVPVTSAPTVASVNRSDLARIRCVCRSTQDDRGRTISCEACGYRQHTRCYGLDGDRENVKGRWLCGICEPSGGVGGWKKGGNGVSGREAEVKDQEEPVVEQDGGKVKDQERLEVDRMDEGSVNGRLGSDTRDEMDMSEDKVVEARATEAVLNQGSKELESVQIDAEMAGSGMDKEKELEKVGEVQLTIAKKKEPMVRVKGPGSGSKPGLGGFKTGGKAAKSAHTPSSKAILLPTKSLTPTVRTVLAPPKSSNKSSNASSSKLPPKSAPTSKPLSASHSKPPSSSGGKSKGVKSGSRASSMNGSPMVRVRAVSHELTPSAPPSPRSGSPALDPTAETVVMRKVEEPWKDPESTLKAPEKEPTPPPSVAPSPVAARTALPPSSPPHPATPTAPTPPKPGVPNVDTADDDIDAALWATEYDHINANIVDASLRERLRSFGREHLAKRAESSVKSLYPPLTPFTSAEPVFLTSSQPTSLVRVKEIKPPPHQHTPTYGVLATGPISEGSLVLEYRCALSDAHAYMSNKAHQYALLGTGTKYVRLVPAPLDVCLDARVMGNEGRFVRCGCWPNAVIRPFICVDGAAEEDDEAEARFGVFALRGLELGEEIVLGWEWSVEHVLHKLVRDPKLGPLPEDEEVLNDPDTKRLWDILDLLRSLSLTCACKPDSSTCALSFGRMLLEDADSVGHASDLGPLVGLKRYENGFDRTLHAVSTKTRRGRKSAGKDRKTRQSAIRPVSPIPKLPSPPPPPVAVAATPAPARDPTPPPRDPTPPPPRDPTPPLPVITTPAKKAIPKHSMASSPLSELSDVDRDHIDLPSPSHAPKRPRGPTRHRRRIESPAPAGDLGMHATEQDEPTVENVRTETRILEANSTVEVPVVAEAEVHDPVEVAKTSTDVVEDALLDVKVEPQDQVSEHEIEDSKDRGRFDMDRSADEVNPEAHDSHHPLSIEAAASEHDNDNDHDNSGDAPKKMSFMDWARRRRATQVTETKEHIPVGDNEVGHLEAEPSLRTDAGLSHPPPPSVSPANSNLHADSTSPGNNSTISPRVTLSTLTHTTPALKRPVTPDTIDTVSHQPSLSHSAPDHVAPIPSDTVMADVAIHADTMGSKLVPTLADPEYIGADASRKSPTILLSDNGSASLSPTRPSHSEPMDVDSVDQAANTSGTELSRASPSPFPDGGQYQRSASHTSLHHSPTPPNDRPTSSPGVPALVKRLSNMEFDQLRREAPSKPDLSVDNNRAPSPSEVSPPPPRAPRLSGDAPEEGEITSASRAPASSYTPSNGSPSATSISLPSGPRDRQPPTQPRRFSVDPPSASSPGSSGSRPTPLPYSRPPPSGPSRGVSLSPRAPPSAPRADRRGYNPSPPTGPRERDRDRERERDRDRDRDTRGRGRGFGGTLPRGPSADRGWRGRGRGGLGRGTWRS